ncbi:hypothetical protein GCK72_024206 [Caenorhabditis remanei]|uniref:Uncharacterized protein n=1 Tax=Caenorhabditis remanei TaxID=31234 RepID=A0A6A5FYI5_CAERE|nr:hypothetical protein GCK72_024206 [Caenorhabditis remanei]KAF1747740.1 hypothetical protein GCK72_024206 [Caenorhabditis remanei]
MSISNPRTSTDRLDTEHKALLIDKTDSQKKSQDIHKNTPIRKRSRLDGVEGFHPSSEDKAGFFSSVIFSYVGVYWWRTRNATTDAELLEKPSKKITAVYAASRLENAWSSNGSPDRHFLSAVWDATKVSVILHAILLCLEELTRVAQPLLLRQLMSYYEIQEKEDFLYWPAMFVALLISFLSFVTVVIHHPYFHGLLNVGNHMRVGTGVLLYKKALRLSLASLADTNSGQLIQLLNTDAAKLEQAFLFAHYVWLCPLLMFFYGFILWFYFGFCCLVGFLVMMIIVTFQVYYSYQLGVNRRNIGDRMDARLKIMSEIINGMKVVKMLVWEDNFAAKIKQLRENEIGAVGKSAFYSSMVMGIYFVSAKIGLFVYIFSCLYFDEDLTTKGVFAASALYNSVRLPFALFLPLGLLFGRELISTSRRINFFFRLQEFSRYTVVSELETETEILKNENDKLALSALQTNPSWILDASETDNPNIQLTDVTSVWYDKVEQREKSMKRDEEFEKNDDPALHVVYAIQGFTQSFKSGECYGVIGSVGSGKSSLLLTILSEARMSKGNVEVHGSIAYCAQEPWIFTGTVRENILFGNDYDRERYHNALELCLLRPDFRQLSNGDMTVVGDNGSTLSGGQRARIALARAIYADADIYLLDDPLSAVDAHVGRKLYENLIRGFLSDKLVVLVTHQIHFLSTLSSVILMKNNKMISMGTLDELKTNFSEEFISLQSSAADDKNDDELYNEGSPSSPPPSPSEKKQMMFEKDEDVVNDIKKKSLEREVSIVKPRNESNLESRNSGSISWSVYWKYTRAVIDPLKFGVCLIICVLVTQFMNNFVDWWLNKWLVDLDEWNAKNSTTKGEFSKNVDILGYRYQMSFRTYEVTFVVSTVVMSFLGVIRSVWFRNAQLNASRVLHNLMFNCLLNTQAEFFDRNSEGAILNRFSKDIGLTDDMLAFTYFEFVFGGLTFLGIVGLVSMVRPVVIIACTFITIGFYLCRKIYVVKSRELKRIEAAARSPLNTIITSTIHGLATIRAYRKEMEMIDKFCALHDVYMAAYNMGILSARWFGICIDFLVSVFVSIVAIVVVLQYETLTVGEVGLCLVCAVQLSGFFSWIMRQSAELENGMVSIERILEYTELKSEEEMRRPHDKYLDDVLEKSWPSKGQIEFENVRVKYGDTYVLNNLNFVIFQGQKIGVVGRTGAGKSTLLKVLFGLKEYCGGQVRIDDVDLDGISLKFRRKGMSIIPQEPVIFSGTIRENLDPYNQYDDATLWEALEQCELKNTIVREKGLHVELGQRGVSLSVGQRQLFCLARAMIHRSRILVIDEATANVDGVTDACIQKTIRNFFKDATIITVAHRLHTIMNTDMIMVFEKGELVEFDKPITLLDDQSSLFARMAAQSGAENLESLRSAAGAYVLEDRKRYLEEEED